MAACRNNLEVAKLVLSRPECDSAEKRMKALVARVRSADEALMALLLDHKDVVPTFDV